MGKWDGLELGVLKIEKPTAVPTEAALVDEKPVSATATNTGRPAFLLTLRTRAQGSKAFGFSSGFFLTAGRSTL